MWWRVLPWLVLVLAAVTFVNSVGLGLVATQVQRQAHQGAVARERQIAAQPALCRVMQDFLRRDVITRQEFAMFADDGSHTCLPR